MFLLDYFINYLILLKYSLFSEIKNFLKSKLGKTMNINENREKKGSKTNVSERLYNHLIAIVLEHCSIGI